MKNSINLDHVHHAIEQVGVCADNITNNLLANPFKPGTSQLFTNNEHQYIEKILSHTTIIKKEAKEIPVKISQESHDDKKLNQYFLTVRHDMRNHVNSIMGYTEMILEDCRKKPTNLDSKKFLAILTQSSKMLEIFTQLQITPSKKAVQKKVDTPVLDVEQTAANNHDEEESHDFIQFKKNFSILIVDDSIANCKVLEHYLLKSGYEKIFIVHDAMEAKKRLSENKFDLALLDINMPVVSGIALLESLTVSISKLELMVVMVTGEDTIENAIKCIKLGAEDFLTKPINAAMLNVRVNACVRKKWFLFKENEYANRLKVERNRFESLLKAIFPQVIINELSETGHVVARTYNNVSMLFVDVVNFTNFCDTHPVEETMKGIQDFSEICEAAAIKYNLQKIKTVGDGFLAIAGMLTKHDNPVLDCVSCAIDILENTKNSPSHWLVRAGIDYGTIIGGIVGHRQYLFDVWGDAVNTAARVQTFASPDKICLTDRAWGNIKDVCVGKSLDFIQLKGKSKAIEIIEFVKKI
jgi:adenylate cyclase